LVIASGVTFFLPPTHASETPGLISKNGQPPAESSKKTSGKAQPQGPTLPALRDLQNRLNKELNELQRGLKESPYDQAYMDRFHDVAVYSRALKVGLELKEYEVKGGASRLAKVAENGISRAKVLSQHKSTGDMKSFKPWVPQNQFENRAYKSRIDDSLQPYSVRFPRDYDQADRPVPLEIVLHGRSDGLTEALFLVQHDSAKANMEPSVILEVFGRGNNAYRFAGETDVFEAMEDLFRRENAGRKPRLDVDRVLLRGFSMGGAGTWHLGLHHSDRFYAIQPGAGFTKSIGYTKLIPENLPEWKKRILARYDAFEAARNLSMVPAVAYSGGDDPQKDAALTIEKVLDGPGMPKNRLTHIIAPGLGHKMPPEWKVKVDAALEPFREKGRETNPETIDLTALSTRHGKYAWLNISGLVETGKPGRVVAIRTPPTLTLTTNGVTHIRLDYAAWKGCESLTVDETRIPLPKGAKLDLVRKKSGWFLEDGAQQPRKSPGLQGPIDDAFMDRFIVTLGRGKPQNPLAQKQAESLLEEFRTEWVKYMRGDFPFVEENAITQEMLKSAHLVVFGDPSSSRILGQAKPYLPFEWNQASFKWRRNPNPDGTKETTKPDGDLLPAMILPNPLHPSKYLVINSGHTFHEKEFQGTNALLFSQLGDFGLWKRDSTTKKWNLIDSGLFHENWAFEP